MVPADQILEIDPREIAIGKRIGFFWPEKAAAIGALMARDGQNEPIKFKRNGNRSTQPWLLVAGLHRLKGAINENMPTIKAIEVSGTKDELLLVEASENIHRRSLGPIERALFIRALADVYEGQYFKGHEGLSAQQIGVKSRWAEDKDKAQIGHEKLADLEAEHSAAIVAGLYGWQKPTAAALDISERSLRDFLLIHRTIVAPHPTLFEAFARSRLGGQRKSVMRVAAIAGDEARGKVMEWLTKNPGADSVEQAKVECSVIAAKVASVATGQTKWMNNAGSNLDKLSLTSWRQYAPVIAAKCTPAALTALRDAIDVRIAELTAKGKLPPKDTTNA